MCAVRQRPPGRRSTARCSCVGDDARLLEWCRMTSRRPLSVRTATGLTTVVCLSGALDPDTSSDLARELRQHLDQAST